MGTRRSTFARTPPPTGQSSASSLTRARGFSSRSRALARGRYDGDYDECARLLLASGADPTRAKLDGETPEAFAQRRQRASTHALLAAAGEQQRASESLSALADRAERDAWLAPSASALAEVSAS